MQLPSGNVTFLFTDIEGSTRLWEQQPKAMRQALLRHDALAQEVATRHNGLIVKARGEGDSLFMVFAHAPDALAAALTLQRAYLAEAWDSGLTLRVRMALHSGEADPWDADYYGPAVNRCARLRAIAHGRQVLLSEAVSERTRDRLPAGAELQSRGQHRLRDLSQPERVYQLMHPDLPAAFPSLRSLDNPSLPNNLPLQIASFVGREKEMSEIRTLLTQTRLLTLTGAGGAGKTRLALQVAADLLDQYRDGVWLVELASLTDPAHLSEAVAQALRLQDEISAAPRRSLTDVLKLRQTLLLLDNCEHLLPACARFVEGLLSACPGVHVLATSREALGIGGEQAYVVPSLTLPEDTTPPIITNLVTCEAIRLFLDRAVAVSSTFAVTGKNASALAQICRDLEGIPLAIELAAAWTRVLPIEQIAARLRDRFRFLTGGNRIALPRHQTLRAMLDWSYDLLPQAERTLLVRLTVFAGGWTLQAAEAICAGETLAEEDVLPLMAQLVNKSLIKLEEAGAEGRYRMLQMVREYGREKLDAEGQTASLRARHADYYLDWVETLRVQMAETEGHLALHRLEADHDNIRAALDCCQDDPAFNETVLQRLIGMTDFWITRGYLSEGRERLTLYLDREIGTPRLRADALHSAGMLAWRQGDHALAQKMLDENLEIRRLLHDEQGLANSLYALGHLANAYSEYEQAQRYYSRSLALWKAQQNFAGVAAALTTLGQLAYNRGNYDEAHACYTQSLSLQRQLKSQSGIADTLNSLGVLARDRGNYAEAERLHTESLAIHRQIGDTHGIAICLDNLAVVAKEQSDFVRAHAYCSEGLRLRQSRGDKQGIAMSLEMLSLMAWAKGDVDAATSLLTDSLAMLRELGNKQGMAMVLNLLGTLAKERRDLAVARQQMQESLRLRQIMWDRQGIAYSLEAFAYLAEVEGQWERASWLMSAAAALRAALLAPLPPTERAYFDNTLIASRAALGVSRFDTAWQRGQEMPLESVVEAVLAEED